MATASPLLISNKSQLASDEDFVHEPLDLSQPMIRVLQILPGRSNFPIRCTLKHMPREENGYVCLSYMWGDDNNCQSILVNGRRLRVRSNLFAFLQLAQKFKIRDWLWIDALCIDQENVQERNHQVAMMAAIYREAKHVLIYPGHVSAAVKVAAKLAWYRPDWSRRFYGKDALWQCSNMWNAMVYRLFKTELLPVSTLHYWQRTWILQEIFLAAKKYVVSASGLVEWETLQAVYDFGNRLWSIWRMGEVSESFHNIIGKRRSMICGGPLGVPFAILFINFYGTQCTDRRDRIYGLLGLFQEPQHLKVDYEQPCSALLFDTLQYLIQGGIDPSSGRSTISCLQIALELSLKWLCLPCAQQSNFSAHLNATNLPAASEIALLHTNHADLDGPHIELKDSKCDRCGKDIFRDYFKSRDERQIGYADTDWEGYADTDWEGYADTDWEVSFSRVSADSALCILSRTSVESDTIDESSEKEVLKNQ